MEAAIRRQDAEAALDVLAELVPEWQRGQAGSQSQAPDPVEVVQGLTVVPGRISRWHFLFA